MKLLLAGAESKKIRASLIECGVRNTLVSYFYIIDRGVDIEEYFDKFENVALDSGGFTFLEKARTSKKGFKADHEKYLNNYLEFIDKHKGRFFWVANFDINIVVGDDKVLEWNELFRKFENVQKVCYIIHDYELPYKNLYLYFDLYDMVGITSNWRGEKDDIGYFEQVYNLSLTKRKLVHGFAMTNFVTIDKFPFYSTDSTTYIGGTKYGSTYVWNGAYFETWDYLRKYKRKGLKHWCDIWNIDYKMFCDDDPKETMKFNIRSWLENEKFFNRKTFNKQWWNQNNLEF
jgi:hypothetical protein